MRSFATIVHFLLFRCNPHFPEVAIMLSPREIWFLLIKRSRKVRRSINIECTDRSTHFSLPIPSACNHLHNPLGQLCVWRNLHFYGCHISRVFDLVLTFSILTDRNDRKLHGWGINGAPQALLRENAIPVSCIGFFGFVWYYNHFLSSGNHCASQILVRSCVRRLDTWTEGHGFEPLSIHHRYFCFDKIIPTFFCKKSDWHALQDGAAPSGSWCGSNWCYGASRSLWSPWPTDWRWPRRSKCLFIFFLIFYHSRWQSIDSVAVLVQKFSPVCNY